MGYGDRMRRAAGWACLALVATLISMGYHFANIRFVPVAAGFAILAGVFWMYAPREQVSSNVIHPGADSRLS
jgi:hypothetical protein